MPDKCRRPPRGIRFLTDWGAVIRADERERCILALEKYRDSITKGPAARTMVVTLNAALEILKDLEAPDA